MGKTIPQHSAGGVVFRCSEDGRGMDVLLIQPAGRDRWQLPKGHIDDGETAETAAVREVREEGGVDARILGALEPIRFFFQMGGQRYVKTVRFFAMAYESGSEQDHDREVDEARWVSTAEATGLLTFESEQDLVRQAVDRLTLYGTPGEIEWQSSPP